MPGLRRTAMLLFCLLPGLLAMPGALASTYFAEQVSIAEHTLRRIGTGTARYAGVIRVYEAALYAPSASTRAQILDAAVPRRLEIVYRRPLDAQLLAAVAAQTLERQHGAETLRHWQAQIDSLHAAFRDVSDGDRLALTMAPEHGLWLEFNGREVARINKPQFGRLYFGIWLGDPPLSASLRDALLPGDCCQAE